MEEREQLQKTLLTPAEASARFNVSLRTIYFWYRTGSIKGINVNGKCLRIFSKSISEFLRSKTAPGGEEGPKGRKGTAKADHTPALPARQGKQAMQRYEGDTRGAQSDEEPAQRPDPGTPIESSPADTEKLGTLMECASMPGYHD